MRFIVLISTLLIIAALTDGVGSEKVDLASSMTTFGIAYAVVYDFLHYLKVKK